MDSQQQTHQSNGLTPSDTVNIVYALAHIWSLPFELLLRRHFGRRYIDIFLLPAAIWPPLFVAFVAPKFPGEWSVWMFGGVILFGGFHRLVALQLDRKGVWRHSQYGGFPIFCNKSTKDEAGYKQKTEPMLVVILAGLSYIISPSMGWFCFGAWASGLIKAQFNRQYQEEQIADLRDAYLEQQSLAQRFQNRP